MNLCGRSVLSILTVSSSRTHLPPLTNDLTRHCWNAPWLLFSFFPFCSWQSNPCFTFECLSLWGPLHHVLPFQCQSALLTKMLNLIIIIFYCIWLYTVSELLLPSKNIFTVTWIIDEGAASSDEELSGGEMEAVEAETQTKGEKRDLKDKLLRRFGSHISSLKLEFSKKKKKGKLPKEARQTLLEWWNVHYKWPYPTVCLLITFLKFSWCITTVHHAILTYYFQYKLCVKLLVYFNLFN